MLHSVEVPHKLESNTCNSIEFFGKKYIKLILKARKMRILVKQLHTEN